MAAVGTLPNDWIAGVLPTTDAQLAAVTPQQLDQLAYFYVENFPGNLAHRRAALRRFLGVQ